MGSLGEGRRLITLTKRLESNYTMICNMVSSTKKVLLLLTAISSLIFGTSMLVLWEDIFQKILNSQLVIEDGTAAFNAWVETPIPVYTKFYFFDLISPRELFHSHEKPMVEERGPYTFREIEKKQNLTWHKNGTVSYRRVKFWYFERELSIGPLTDTIITVNVPVVGAAEFGRGNMFMEWGISDMLATLEARIFVNRTIGELLFDGYEDAVMKMADSFDNYEAEEYEAYDEFEFEEYAEESGDSDDEIVKSDKKEKSQVPMDKFGWFYKRNGTSWSDGYLNMHTGQNDMMLLGKIASWNNSTRTEAYPGECGRVSGSSDGLFSPGETSFSDSISIFSTDMCRPLHFTRSEKQELHGIPVNTFELSHSNFANSSVCPGNSCYNNNIPSGVQNVTRCKTDSPVFVSRPHFHLADKFYKEQFQYGIEAKEGAHDSSFWVEPTSSIPVKVEMRLQLNVFLRKVEGIEYLFKNLPEVMFPVFWFESVATLPETMAGSLNLLLLLPAILQACGVCCLVSSISLLIIIFLYEFKHQTRESAKTSPQGHYINQVDCTYTQVPNRDIIKKHSVII